MPALAETINTLDLRLPSPVEEVCDERLARRGVRLLLKRDDLIHPEITGNKYRKLKYNLEAVVACGLVSTALHAQGGDAA